MRPAESTSVHDAAVQPPATLPTQNGDDTALRTFLASQSSTGCRTEVFAPGTEPSLGEGDTYVIHGFLDLAGADRAFQQLDSTDSHQGEIEYQQWYHMADLRTEKKKGQQPLRPLSRIKVAQCDPDTVTGLLPHYRFPVNSQSKHGTTRLSPTVKDIRSRVMEHFQSKAGTSSDASPSLNHAVVLLYRTGDDRIGLHKDKPLDLEDGAPVVSVSLGEARTYVLQDDNLKPTRRQEITLTHGALLVLGAETNLKWYHSVTDKPTVATEADHPPSQHRVSVTLRSVATFIDEKDGTLTGKGAAYQTPDWPEELKGVHRELPSELALGGQ